MALKLKECVNIKKTFKSVGTWDYHHCKAFYC